MSKNLKLKVQNTNKGITLVALIVTVIVLAILATVSIQAINGEGIIGRAQEVAFKAEMANLQEDLGLFVSAREVGSKNGFDLSTLNASIGRSILR